VSARPSRFGSLAQAVKDRAAAADEPRPEPAGQGAPAPAGAGLHKPAAALGTMAEGLRERVARLEAQLAQASGRNTELERELGQARSAASRAGESVEEFLFLDPAAIRDELPRDRLPGAFAGAEFEALLADIQENGQNDAITVRPAVDGSSFEVAAGRRRLEACRRLGRPVLARVRPLDETAMLRVQFSENERREDISALERSRWFAEVKARLDVPSKDIAAQFGLDPSTLSLYLRLARFPAEILARLREPRRLSVLRARRVMEALEADAGALPRILAALDAQARHGAEAGPDPEGQIDVLMRAAEGRGGDRPATHAPVPDRRHVVHRGRRVGTLTRNGGQWVFRFATTIGEDVVQALADRIGDLVAKVEAETTAKEPR
jgi:ParB family chromosome partitioning protein